MENQTTATNAESVNRVKLLEQQNELLHKQNAWLRRFVAGSVALAGFAAFVGSTRVSEAQPRRSREVVAEKFVLVDKNGKKRAVLGQDEVYGLSLFDEDEHAHAAVFANKQIGSGFSVFANKLDGKKQVGIQQLPNGSAAIIFNDGAGKARILLATQSDDKPAFILSDENGKAIFSQGQ